MAWPSLFSRKAPAEPVPHPAARQAARRRTAGATESPPADIEQVRTRARRRLIGATVLLGIGVIAFPLLFETEPRPIPVDLPIDIPRPDAVPPLAVPPASSGASSGTVAEPPAAKTAKVAEPAPAKPPEPTAPAAPAATAAPQTAETPPPTSELPATPSPAPSNDGARAKALLEGRPPATALDTSKSDATVRYVVQVGAYADDSAVRAVRTRVEGLGLRTYTQVIKVDAGDRTRVRVGPFDERAQADDVAQRLKQAGLPAAVLRL